MTSHRDRRWLPWLMLALVALAGAAERTAARELAEWETPAFLTESLSQACDLVEAACGATYPKRPELRITSRRDITEIVREEMDGILRKLGASSDAEVARVAQMLGRALVAKYEPATNVVHVLPDNLRSIVAATSRPELLTRDTLRVLLIHEATHALDFQRFPLEAARQGRASRDGIQAVGAVIEGHAQFVAERIAAAEELTPAFEAFTALILTPAPASDPAERLLMDVVMAEVRFAYERGHAFVKAVHEARGREGVEALLTTPPEDVRMIEDPARYLEPDAERAAFDPAPVFAALGPLFEAAKLTVEAPAPFRQVELQAAYGMLGTERVKALSEDYDQGRLLVGRLTDEFVALVVMAFDDAAGAMRYQQALEDLLRKKDEAFADHPSIDVTRSTYEPGVGRDHARSGLRAHKELTSMGRAMAVTTHCGTVGRIVVEMSLVALDVSQDEQDAWMEAALAALPVPEEAAADEAAAPEGQAQPAPEPEPAGTDK